MNFLIYNQRQKNNYIYNRVFLQFFNYSQAYKLPLVEIQNNDFIPLLDFHFALLCKSKYGLNRDFTITFKEIDTPTELERAQINSTKAQTDSTYISSGVLSPDEIRSNLITNSGYNDIEGELPEDETDIDFSDEETDIIGNETNQKVL